MAQFSSNESISLEKQADLLVKPVRTDPDNLETIYEISECVRWIVSNNFKTVCLQFPDYMLPDSSQVALKMQEEIEQIVYVLGDTSYGSCCVDYVAAAHVNADAIIHFGPVCFSESSTNIPVLNIYEKNELNIEHFQSCLIKFKENKFTILIDTPYFHCYDKLIAQFGNLAVEKIQRDIKLNEEIVIYLGKNNIKLLNIQLLLKPKNLLYYDATVTPPKLNSFEEDNKLLKRRNFLIEKIKDSQTIGIIIGTLSVKNYLKMIERLKQLIELNGKKYYLICVGKPTVGKLANFPELDIYCIVTCSLNEIFNNREFYKPIVTPYDVEMALNSSSNTPTFSFDFNVIFSNQIPISISDKIDVSLISGKIRSSQENTEILDYNDKLVLKNEGTLSLNYGANYLLGRSWRGLEQNLGMSEVKLTEDGRRGVAESYENERNG